MRRALIALVAALALAVVPLGSAETSYSDPAGDSGRAPDITTVAVSNTTDGTVTFKVSVGNYTVLPTFPPALVSIGLFLDLDKNPNTGDLGDEGYAHFDSSGAVDFERWNGSDMVDVPETSMSSSFSSGVLTFTVARSELLNTTGFSFELFTINIDLTVPGVVPVDRAPNTGMPSWSYDLVLPPPPVAVKPVIGKPVVLAAPIAGKLFTITFPVVRSDDGTPLTTATVGCTTTVAGKTIPHTHTFKSGTVKTTLVVPKAAKGKQLKIAVKVTAGSQAATKVVTFKVK